MGKPKDHKRKKKEKKSKHYKKHHRHSSSDSSSDSDHGNESHEKGEKFCDPLQPSTSRQDESRRDKWMEVSDFVPTYSMSDIRVSRQQKRVAEREEARKRDKDILSQRELNPFWKDGGKGLPEEETEKMPTSTNFGDGGLTWLRKAYRRIQEQAANEQLSMEEIAAERWGSLAKLENQIRDAEDKMKIPRRERMHFTSTPPVHREEARKPAFRRPAVDADDIYDGRKAEHSDRRRTSNLEDFAGCRKIQSWKKTNVVPNDSRNESLEASESHKQCDTAEKPEILGSTSGICEEEISVLTDAEMNALASKLVKAELVGNAKLAAKLKTKIEKARQARAEHPDACQAGADRTAPETVILTRTDRTGFSRPLAASAQPDADSKSTKRIKANTHDRDGKRIRYFADDDKHSLKEMFERERATTSEDQNAEFARMVGKVRGSTHDDYDFDDALTDTAAKFDMAGKQNARDRAMAIQEHKHMTKALDGCKFCLESKELKRHLIIAIGIRCYLCLPWHKSLVEGHCYIVPNSHVSTMTVVDEDVYLEMQVFRKGLARLFADRDQDTVFMETAMHLNRFPHCVLECIPLPKDIGEMAPMYFKKAILESETEWAHNVKLVDLSKKGFRNSVPKGLPYFSVDFGLDAGFAHVIEDENRFPKHFGHEILGGMLDLEPRNWLKPRNESFSEQSQKALQFTQWWKPYDWTKRLMIQGDTEEDK